MAGPVKARLPLTFRSTLAPRANIPMMMLPGGAEISPGSTSPEMTFNQGYPCQRLGGTDDRRDQRSSVLWKFGEASTTIAPHFAVRSFFSIHMTHANLHH